MLALRQVARFSTARALRNASEQVVAPKRKVGAFRGGLLGFLLGTTATGYGAYYYLFDEYRSANSVVISDVLSLQESIRQLEAHVQDLEHKVSK